MGKLMIDIDEIGSALEAFQQLHGEFQAAYEQLNKAIDDLQNSGWVSGASTAYFQQYEGTWKKNMEKHIQIFEHLAECLTYAKGEYGAVVDAVPTVEKAIL